VAISGELPVPVEYGSSSSRAGGRPDPTQVNTLVDLYRSHQQRIYRYCLALLRNPDDAEDATQETFTRAAPFLPNLPGDLSAYLTTVARNICCDVVRARARRSVPIETVPLADRKVSPERQSVDWDVVRRMWRQLSPSERLLFAYTFAGYKYEEIANRTGMSRPSVSVGLARARRRLRDLAAATGTLALLPLGLRRLLERLVRRANAAASSAQTTVLGMADQVGLVVTSLLAGLFVVSASAPAAQLPMTAATAQRPAGVADPTIQSAATTTVPVPAAHLAPTGGAARTTGTTHQSGSSVPQLPGGASWLLPGAEATPVNSGINQTAASPNYPSDHTVLVAGTITDGCVAGPSCAALFRTTDAGVSWSRLAYLTYKDGLILLPPTYPTDPAIFMLVPYVGLEESPSGDGTFNRVIPGISNAAIAPWSPPGQDEVAGIAGNALQIYPPEATTPASTATLPANFVAGSVVFTAPDVVAVGGWMGAAGGPLAVSGVGAVTLCPLSGACGPAVTLPGSTGVAPILGATPSVATDHVVVATMPTGAYISRDSGRSFTLALPAPSGTAFQTGSVGEGPAGPRILLSTARTPQRPKLVILSSDDLGQSFTGITGNLDSISNLVGTAAYPDGTILAALGSDAQNRFALRQTTGNGTWIIPS
jgi:RNA polymerase sigma factor (sigma-70 family)